MHPSAQLKHEHRARLMKELEAKKTVVERAIQQQTEHDVGVIAKVYNNHITQFGLWQKTRETKLAQLRGVFTSPRKRSTNDDIGLPGQSGPAVDNNGHAVGYGVDFGHTAVDSEGNPTGSSRN